MSPKRGARRPEPPPTPTIFDAARSGDVDGVRAFLDAGADPAATNAYGFTALHCAATGANTADPERIAGVMRLLLDAGAALETKGGEGRTALYLAAEFARSAEPVQLLLDAGAEADITDDAGVHVVENANSPEVQKLLSRASGHPAPPPRVERKAVKLTAAAWRAAKARLDPVFDALAKNGLVVLQDAGQTQEDGFADCAEVFRERGGEKAGLRGFCFYTRQDLNRAKRTSLLSLAFWAAPEGRPKDMMRVGAEVVAAFRDAGFEVDWNGSAAMRPTVVLSSVKR